MSSIEFNTGRKYAAEGQIVRAMSLDNGRIVFADITRGIYGILPEGTELTQSSIMQAYDAGLYSYHPQAYGEYRINR